MLHFKNLKLYTPESPPYGSNALYFRDEDGNDFYESLPLFSQDTVKVCYDSTGNIIQFNTDATSLCPIDVSILEMEQESIPDDLTINGKWKMDTEKLGLVLKDNFTSVAFAKKKDSLLVIADDEISAIQDRIDLGQREEGDEDLLVKWKLFRISVRTCKEGDNFPDMPM